MGSECLYCKGQETYSHAARPLFVLEHIAAGLFLADADVSAESVQREA